MLACGDAEPAESTGASLPHVIVLSLDTVRADRLGCYGGSAATPHLDALASASDRYASCTAPSSWTLPSHASLFTGLFPFEHGTHGFRVDGMVDNVHPLHPDHATLAEELEVVGYETAAFAANTVYLAPRYGVAQGFRTYELKRQPAAAATSRVLEFLDERAARADDRPLFLFVNYMDAHRPYAAFSPEEVLRLPKDENPAALLEALCVRVMNDGEAPGELGLRVSGLYDLALARLDAEIGRLLEGLRERRLFDDAVIVVTSDHGEAFGEHGVVEHAKDVFEPLVSVPLIVKRPGQAEGRVALEGASLVDVPGLVAVAVPGSAGDELRRTFGRLPGNHALTAELHYARPREIVLYQERFQRVRTALRDGRYKLIVGGDAPELYDLEADPGETHDIAASEPARVDAMRAALRSFQERGAYAGERLMPEELTDEQLSEMDALGYGGGR